MSNLQDRLLQIFAQTTGFPIEEIPLDRPLLELGIGSLALVDAFRVIQEQLGVRPSIRRVFEEFSTVERFTAYIEDLLQNQPAMPAPQPIHRLEGDRLPVGDAWRHLWFLASYSEGASSAFNESVVLELNGPLDAGALSGALRRAQGRHEALRARMQEDGLALVIEPPDAVPGLEILDLRDASETALAKQLADCCGQLLAPQGILFRSFLLYTGEDQAFLVLVGHALVVDRASLQGLLQELAQLYQEIITGQAALLAEAVPLRRYLEALEAHLSGPEGQAHQAWWLSRFVDGLPRAELPTDRPRPPIKAYEGARVALRLPSAEAFGRWCGSLGYTPFMAIVMLFELIHRRYTENQDAVIGLIGRFDPPSLPLGSLVAGTANPLLLQLSAPGESTLKERLAQVRLALLDAYEHSACSFSTLVKGLEPARDQSRSALFTVAVESLPQLVVGNWPDLDVQPVTASVRQCRYDLHLRVVEAENGLEVQCDYSTELFDRRSVVRLLQTLRLLIEQLPTSADHLAADVELLSSETHQKLLSLVGPPLKASGMALSLPGRLAEQVQRSPDAEAVVHPNERLSYRQLWARVEAIAGALQGTLLPEERVGVCMERTPDQVAAFFAVQYAGGAYVPLDPAWPEARLRLICADAGIRQVLTDQASAVRVENVGVALRRVDGLRDAPSDLSANFPVSGDLAYVMYTSGSTGRPKGVMVEQRGLVALVDHALELFPVEAFRSVLAATSFSFDVSAFEIYVPLCCGGTVVLAQDVLSLSELPDRDHLTLSCMVPSALGPLLDVGLPPCLRWLILGGEAIHDPTLLPRLWAVAPDAQVWNGYGPTEDTVYALLGEIKPTDSPRLLGGPIAGAWVYVLDDRQNVTPPGAEGELYLGGAGVARGYLGQPELSATRFIADPFRPGNQLYRTGDRVRVGDGQLFYMGRRDHQVKLRGFRIELEEIEGCLLQQPQVVAAVVQKWAEPGGGEHLVAWVVGISGLEAVSQLRAALALQLPAYMVPGFFVPMSALPLLPNGKLDRSRLPSPQLARASLSSSDYAPPQTPLQQVLAGIWERVLKVDRVGLGDDFFHLGGTSLKMTEMLHAIRHTFQVRPRLRAFFDAPTLQELAAHIQHLRDAEGAAPTEVPELRAEARFAWLGQDAGLDAVDSPQTPLVVGAPKHILMTGATGFVGAHILRELVLRSDATLYCLCRGRSPEEGWKKLKKAMESYHLEDGLRADRIVVVPGDIVLPRLGLDPEAYAQLARTIDCVYHGAAAVNFIYPYHALRAINVEGTREVIRFAFAEQRKPLHYVSTAAIWPMGGHRRFFESDSIDHNIDLNMGYDESKWVAEKLLAAASARGLPVSIYRPGEVAGHSESGQSVEGHFLFAMLKGCLQIKAFPRLGNWLDLSPVDYCAEAIAHLLLNSPPGQTFHTTNPTPMQVRDLYAWLRHIGYDFEELSFQDWKQHLLRVPDLSQNALYPYVSLIEEFEEQNLELPQYDCSKTLAALEGSNIQCAAVAPPLLWRYITYLAQIGFMDLPPRVE